MNSAVPGPVQQILPQKFANVCQDFRRTGGMQTVAAKIGSEPRAVETSRIATNRWRPIHHRYFKAAPAQAPSRT
jgi:hypothetical protein